MGIPYAVKPASIATYLYCDLHGEQLTESRFQFGLRVGGNLPFLPVGFR
jgi:hypothetical protein